MLRVGLTGGVASGKSTVAAMMRELGCTVLEADALAHRLMEPGQPAYDEVVREFGSAILRPEDFGAAVYPFSSIFVKKQLFRGESGTMSAN